jgi:hypothetical protein
MLGMFNYFTTVTVFLFIYACLFVFYITYVFPQIFRVKSQEEIWVNYAYVCVHACMSVYLCVCARARVCV